MRRSVRPPGCAQTDRPRDFALAGIRRGWFVRSVDPHTRRVEGALRGRAGEKARAEADPGLVLALGRVAPGRGVCEGSWASAELAAEQGAHAHAELGVAAAALLRARPQRAGTGSGVRPPQAHDHDRDDDDPHDQQDDNDNDDHHRDDDDHHRDDDQPVERRRDLRPGDLVHAEPAVVQSDTNHPGEHRGPATVGNLEPEAG